MSPIESVAAPLNAPRLYPNSSLSISSLGNAAQFTATNGAFEIAGAFVNRARDQLFTGASFATYEN